MWSSSYPQPASVFQPTSSIHIFFPTLTSLECQDDSGYPRPEVIKSEGTLSWLNPSWQVLPVLQTRLVRSLAERIRPWAGKPKEALRQGWGTWQLYSLRFQRCFCASWWWTNIQKNEVHEGIFQTFPTFVWNFGFSKQACVYTGITMLRFCHVSWHQFFPGVSRQTCRRSRSDPAKSWCQNDFPTFLGQKTTLFLYFGTHFSPNRFTCVVIS